MKCPHCKAELVPHEDVGVAKEGALHCYECGCCFLADGKTPREGVPVCALAPLVKEEPVAAELEEPEEPEMAEPPSGGSARGRRA